MLKGEYTRTELGVKRGNIQWKVTVNDVILLFVNEGLGNKPESTYMYANHLDIEKDILYMCRDTDLTWRNKLLKELDDKEYRIFYRDNKKPIWNEFIYENIELVDNGVAAIGKKL